MLSWPWLAGLVLVAGLSIWGWLGQVEQQGYERARAEYQQADLSRLTALIQSSRALEQAAQEASRVLLNSVQTRQQADAKTTKEIRHALAASAPERAACLFDAGVMQQLDAARDRATRAAASGLSDALPSSR